MQAARHPRPPALFLTLGLPLLAVLALFFVLTCNQVPEPGADAPGAPAAHAPGDGAAAAVASGLPAPTQGVFHELSFEAACALAEKHGRVVVVDFFTTWCGPCKKLDRDTWPAESVATWLGEHAIALKVDAEKDTELAGRFRVSAYPTIVVAAADGREIARKLGFLPPADFLAFAEAALAPAAQ